MIALIRKEIRAFFGSFTGYIVVGAFLLMTGLFLWIFPGDWNILDGSEASLSPLFAWAPWIFMGLIPAIVMRSFAEEEQSGTMELLLTRPLSDLSIIGAKFIGALFVLLMSILPTLAFLWVIGSLGKPAWNVDLGAVWGSYLGLFLLGSSMTALGLLASALTRNSLSAFLAASLASIVGYIGFTAMSNFGLMGGWDYAFAQLGMEAHYRGMVDGAIDSRDLAYFILFDVLALFATKWALRAGRGNPRQEAVQFFLRAAVALVLYTGICALPTHWDWTAEKRHSLTEATEDLLGGLEDDVTITCYLTGSFPAEWHRLELAIAQNLENMADRSNGHLRYQFVDIYDELDSETMGQNEEALYEQGLRFTRIAYDEGGAKSFKMIWPAAVVRYRNREEVIQFFRAESIEPTQAMIQSSINGLEFELVSALRRAIRSEKRNIAWIRGHGELNSFEGADFMASLEEDYVVTEVEIKERVGALGELLDGMKRRTNRFDLAIVAKPDSTWSSKDQVLMDQFIMNGGKVLWLIDPILTDLDSLASNQFTTGTTNEIGLYDLLFQYGARLNRNLVIDPQCAPIMLGAGPMGGQENFQMFSWYFAPIALPQTASHGISHPITTNLDPVHFDFVSRVDPVGNNPEIKQTVLLSSSERAREYKAPVRISSGIVDLDPSYFDEGNVPNQPFAVLLEGIFTSGFENRLPQKLLEDETFSYQRSSRKTAMIVVGDGDLARNELRSTAEGIQVLPLGYDRYAGRVVYDNKEFLMNAVNYLLDDAAVISVRSRAITHRGLDEEKVREEGLAWQSIALAIPLAVVGVAGWSFMAFRRKKWAHH